MLDIFKADPFQIVPLTDAINQIKFVPGRLAQLGIFQATRVRSLSVAIERKGSQLILVPPSPRGAPGTTVDKGKRSMLDVRVPHFEINDAVIADEVQGVRAFGTETELESVMDKIAERSGEHSQSMAATTEYSQIGAIKGVVTYAPDKDGVTQELNLFTTFGVSQIAEQAMDLGQANIDNGPLRKKSAGLKRLIGRELDGIPFTGKLRGFCGDNFFDDLLGNKEVRETYKGWTQAQILREGYIEADGKSWGAFEFSDVIWENYRGTVSDVKGDMHDYVESDKAYIIPEGVPGLFRTYWAPADYNETVNTLGKRLYGKIYDMPNGKGTNLDVQMNELNICTRPRVLLKAKRQA
jgi:hypothetical protein